MPLPQAQPPHWANWNSWLGQTAPPTQPAGSEVPPAPEGLFLGPRQLQTHWLPCVQEGRPLPAAPLPPSPSPCLPPPPSPGVALGSHTS